MGIQHLTPTPRGTQCVRTGTVWFVGVGNGRTVEFSHRICYYLVRPLVSSPGWHLTRLYVQRGLAGGPGSGGTCHRDLFRFSSSSNTGSILNEGSNSRAAALKHMSQHNMRGE